MEPLPLIFDFAEDDIHKNWIVVNDNVMEVARRVVLTSK